MFCLTAFMNVLKIFFIKQLNHGQKLSAHGRPPKNRIGPAHPMVFVSKIFGPWVGLGWAGPGWAGLGRAGLGWAGPGWAGLGRAGRGLAHPIRSSVPYNQQTVSIN